MSPESKISFLKDRAAQLKAVRTFFDQRQVMEVDCPLLGQRPSIDLHIDLFPVAPKTGNTKWLYSSPEYSMKCLLALGLKDIYQLSHVFRSGEKGNQHNPEFTLIEWYRCTCPFNTFLEEVLSLIHLFLGPLPYTIHSYFEIFEKITGLSYHACSNSALADLAQRKGIDLNTQFSQEEQIDLIWSYLIQPTLGQHGLSVIIDYPVEQACLAQTTIKHGQRIAERFEVFYKGTELGNGYHELQDPVELKKRLEQANQQRIKYNKTPFPIDPFFIESHVKGLPDCYGIAVGFDRLMMLRHKVDSIDAVLPFTWEVS